MTKWLGNGNYRGYDFKIYQFDNLAYQGWVIGAGVSEEFDNLARCHLYCLGKIREIEKNQIVILRKREWYEEGMK